MRKYLGVLAGALALCMLSWAQAPDQTPAPAPTEAPAQTPTQAPAPTPAQRPVPTATPTPTPNPSAKPAPPPVAQFPRLEFFAGGSYAEAGLFNAGHWAGLPGWDSSLGINMTSWVGIVLDGGQYFGTSKIPVAVPAPFPTCPPFCPLPTTTFNVSTREYNVLFGFQFARRKYERWTPIGEVMYGHQGTRGKASAQGQTFSEVSSGRGIVAGGGLDYKVTPRLSMRLKCDYLQTGSFKQTQDNVRFSVGVMVHNVHKKRRRLEDETQTEP
ncbi:MAG: outer membrane beta-barrel protein [Terriglobales bacterium]